MAHGVHVRGPVPCKCGTESLALASVQPLVEAKSLVALKYPSQSHISRLIQLNKETRLFAHKLATFLLRNRL